MGLVRTAPIKVCSGSGKKPSETFVTEPTEYKKDGQVYLRQSLKGVCPQCHKSYALTKKGDLNSHNLSDPKPQYYLQIDSKTYGQLRALDDMFEVETPGDWARGALRVEINSVIGDLPPGLEHEIKSEITRDTEKQANG